jgi:hypothetical protein
MAQVVDYLLCKHEAVTSNPSATKNNPKNKNKIMELGAGGANLLS